MNEHFTVVSSQQQNCMGPVTNRALYRIQFRRALEPVRSVVMFRRNISGVDRTDACSTVEH